MPLGWEDPLEKEMTAHSSILSWSLAGHSPQGHKESDASEQLNNHNQLVIIEKGARVYVCIVSENVYFKSWTINSKLW